MKIYKEFLKESVKWNKEWYNYQFSPTGKKIYSYTTEDGKFTIVPTGENPESNFKSSKSKKTFWRIIDKNNSFARTFTTLPKAKAAVVKLRY